MHLFVVGLHWEELTWPVEKPNLPCSYLVQGVVVIYSHMDDPSSLLWQATTSCF